ncbi:hypothetical protein CDAR_606061 [Caerostris darwini]|uniref:Uncharacterized protein n=1 Tax=Caerostris darwini TaxID=1538125 RepID=A0AAV4RFS0_9ARAC|nr:hypothetical protein CDAR_606061 [Caerostris darwini]
MLKDGIEQPSAVTTMRFVSTVCWLLRRSSWELEWLNSTFWETKAWTTHDVDLGNSSYTCNHGRGIPHGLGIMNFEIPHSLEP